jgi:hypothetical protein
MRISLIKRKDLEKLSDELKRVLEKKLIKDKDNRRNN